MTQTSTTLNQGDDMARQTAQAKLLREARDELAARAAKMTRRELIALGLPETAAERMNKPGPKTWQQPAHLVSEIADGAAFTSADLAEILGVSLITLRGWMAPADNPTHREMPKTARLLLDRILADGGKR